MDSSALLHQRDNWWEGSACKKIDCTKAELMPRLFVRRLTDDDEEEELNDEEEDDGGETQE